MFLGILLGSFLSRWVTKSFISPSYNRHILLFTLGTGLSFWVIDSFVDMFLFDLGVNRSLLQVLVTGVPLEELYMRSMMVLICCVFGVFFSKYIGMYRRSQVALLESEERLRQLAETIPEVFWLGSFDWQEVHYVSPAYHKIWGLSCKSLYDDPLSWYGAVAEEDRQKVMDAIPNEIMPGIGQIIFPEYRIIRPDGSFRWIQARAFPIWGSDGKENRIVGLAEDITVRHRAEEDAVHLEWQLRQARKMEAIGTLAGGIAHDFNNILTPILGYASMALDKMEADSPFQKHLRSIQKAGTRAKDLVNQILTFSRQAGQELQPLRVQLVVKEAMKLLRSTIPTTINIKQDIDNSIGNVLADPTQIHQIVMNLCTNSYHAMRDKGGLLRVSLGEVIVESGDLADDAPIEPGSYLRLEVEDSGYGIPATVMDKIFEPYFTTKGKGEGTGMGLAVVHGIVRRHRGHITVESAPGQGTLFTVYLPLVDAYLDELEAIDEEPVKGGSEHILVVDDEVIVEEMMKAMLESMGYTVTSKSNSLSALHVFTDHPDHFDLVITDMTMPNLTGAELTKKILAIRPEMPIILATGYSELINEEKAKELGVAAFVMKPLVKRQLDMVIREVLDDAVDLE